MRPAPIPVNVLCGLAANRGKVLRVVTGDGE
jgi:hypothetical protein